MWLVMSGQSIQASSNINLVGYGGLVAYLSLVVPSVIDTPTVNYYSLETQIFLSALTGVCLAIASLQTTTLIGNQYFRTSKSGNPEGIMRLKIFLSCIGTCGGLILCTIGHGAVHPDIFGVCIPWVLWAEWVVTFPLLAASPAFFKTISSTSRIDINMVLSQLVFVLGGYSLSVDALGTYWSFVCILCCCYAFGVAAYYLYRTHVSIANNVLNTQGISLHHDEMKRLNASFRSLRILVLVMCLYTSVYIAAAVGWLGSDWTCVCFLAAGILHRALISVYFSIAYTDDFQPTKDKLAVVKKASEQKMSYLKFVFHEARVPLQSLSLGLRLLDNAKTTAADREETLDMMREAAAFISGTFDDVLSVQKVQDGALELKLEFFDLRKVLESVAKSLTSPMLDKRFEFILDISPDLPRALEGDSFRISHAVANFLSNAIKFAPPNTTLIVRATCCNDPSTSISDVLVEVIDQGPGISEEHQKHLFKAYMQINAEEIQNGRGTGLGLSLCHHVITLHGGEVTCRSSVGKGSNFGFLLPLRYSNDPLVLLDGEAGRNAGRPCNAVDSWVRINSGGPRRRSKRIARNRLSVGARFMVLIVDDSADNNKLLQRLLYLRDISSDIVEDGYQALNLLNHEVIRYDFIFMNNGMPDRNGLDTVRLIRRIGYKNIVVGLTGCAFDSDCSEFIDAGADCVLTKPVDVQALDRLLDFIAEEGPASRLANGICKF